MVCHDPDMDKVYPRVCGGSTTRSTNPPPIGGSIPACAGEASSSVCCPPSPAVYPRVCGGSLGVPVAPGRPGGLSPRVRGKPGRRLHAEPPARSIPACAGEATLPATPARWPGVYPRVCGGSMVLAGSPVVWPGLSPRVRGKHPAGPTPSVRRGSIPACAGEAGSTSRPQSPHKVYPRVCGGSASLCATSASAIGLSPRVRGKPFLRNPTLAVPRSIPACAGEAFTSAACRAMNAVYPRVCGGSR